jgi:hypothetical protein
MNLHLVSAFPMHSQHYLKNKNTPNEHILLKCINKARLCFSPVMICFSNCMLQRWELSIFKTLEKLTKLTLKSLFSLNFQSSTESWKLNREISSRSCIKILQLYLNFWKLGITEKKQECSHLWDMFIPSIKVRTGQ